MNHDYIILIPNSLLLDIWILCVFFGMDSVCLDLNFFCGFAQSFISAAGTVLEPLRSVAFLYRVTFILQHLGYGEQICASMQQMADHVGTLYRGIKSLTYDLIASFHIINMYPTDLTPCW